MSPRRQHHHDNSCHDNSCHDDGSRPTAPGRLVRSRSDETLANVSVLARQRQPSSTRRRKKTTAAVTDRLITDFNEGKEVDLDTLTAHLRAGFDSGLERNSKPPEHHRAGFDSGLERNSKPPEHHWAGFDSGLERNSKPPEHSDVLLTRANVRNWLRTQNDASKWAESASKCHSVDVHHL